MSELLRRTLGETIDLAIETDRDLWCAMADSAQLETSILNLCINAQQAMPDGGQLTVEAHNAALDAAYARQHVDVEPGDYVLIAVTDNGSGMDEETVAQAFEPFFTTKQKGQGTGLGLSMVFGFVKQSNGHIRIYSEPGLGTTVKIYLPRADGDAHHGKRDDGSDDVNLFRAGGSILLVEDDDLVREHVTGQLMSLGYDVLAVGGGAEALDVLAGTTRFDLLLTDVVMPGGIDGKALADRAAALRPDLPVLFMSGYAESAIVHQGRLDPGVHLLPKPYTLKELSDHVLAAIKRGENNE